jgi:hypothetical protein
MRANATQDLIYRYLERARRPVPVSEVIDYIVSVKEYKGCTPRNTVSAIIRRSQKIKKLEGRYLTISRD